MSKTAKAPASKAPLVIDASKFCKSTFTLTFAVEVVGIDVWHDCNEGWLDLGPCVQALKLQYQLYYGQMFDIDILIWPHTAKIWCRTEYGWVRTWQFLERRFLSFSITHAFPVRVVDLQNFVATVIPTPGLATLGATAKNDKNFQVYLPPLQFGERRYFAPVLETIEESLRHFISKLLWNIISSFIPPSYLDGPFDIPHAVTDLRHQDSVLYHVRETILNRLTDKDDDIDLELEEDKPKISKRDAKSAKEKVEDKKKVDASKIKFELLLSGDTILAGVGRVVHFEHIGERPLDLGEIIVLVSTNNLPAHDDLPLIFINVDTLIDAPLKEFKKLRIAQLYTRWILGDEIHESQPQYVKVRKNTADIKFNDHHAVPLEPELAPKVTAIFLDDTYEIQLRGIKNPLSTNAEPKFFGYEKSDRYFSTVDPPKLVTEELDFLIAVTKIDTRSLAKGANCFIRGEYCLYPPKVEVVDLEREGICTNDINAIKAPVIPKLVVQPSLILEAQMSLEVSLGLVGCRPQKLPHSYQRMFLLNKEADIIMAIIRKVININEELINVKQDMVLTGFALDTGDTVLFYLEGPKDGHILRVWDMTEDFYSKVRPIFSTSARYVNRIYPELACGAVPFVVLKMYAPLGVVLACPSIYSRPALPLPTRSAALKIGRIVASGFRVVPCRSEMPTTNELKSFRLELCAPPQPPTVVVALSELNKPHDDETKAATQSVVIWEQQTKQNPKREDKPK